MALAGGAQLLQLPHRLLGRVLMGVQFVLCLQRFELLACCGRELAQRVRFVAQGREQRLYNRGRTGSWG